MICRRPLQRTPKAPALKQIPEEQSVSFRLHDDSGLEQLFPGLLERDFEDLDIRLVNRSRVVRKIDPLRRSTTLDTLAQMHAECMAQCRSVQHSVSNVNDLKKKLKSHQVGENVQRGESVVQIHRELLKTAGQTDSFLFNNMVSPKYNEMGSGQARGKDGYVYWVQLFRSSEEPMM